MDDDISAPRKLTSTETTKLRSLLKSKLNLHSSSNTTTDKQQAEEDASDLLDYTFAMIANGKNVRYVVDELKSMEMDVCDGKSADMLGRTLGKYLKDLNGGSGSGGGVGGDNKKKDGSSGSLNALANSGALGSSRIGGGRGGGNQQQHNNNSNDNPAQRNNDNFGGRGGNFDNSRGRGGGRMGGRGNDYDGRGGRGGGPGRQQRSLHGAAFDRLNRGTRPPQDHRNFGGRGGRQQQQQQQHNSRPMDNNRGGSFGGRNNDRGGRGGRNTNMGGGRGNFRDAPQHQQHNKRKGRDEKEESPQDFVSTAMEHGLASYRNNNQQQQSKRPRYDDNIRNNDDQHMDEDYDSWQGRGRGGGRSFGRGRGGRGGRGSGGRGRNSYEQNSTYHESEEGTSATEEAAAVSESPLVQQSFGRGSGGRGFYRGGRGGRGRGRGRAGRAEVLEAVKAKTWVRPRTMEEGLATER